MKKTIVTIFGLICTLNILAGLVFSAFSLFNVAVSTLSLILTAIFCLWVYSAKLKDAFKVSLLAIIPVIGLIQYVIGILMPNSFENNVGIILIALSLAIEIGVLIISFQVSKHIR